MQRLHGFLNRRVIVKAVDDIQVQIVRPQAFQAAVDLPQNCRFRQAAFVKIHFGDERHLVSGNILFEYPPRYSSAELRSPSLTLSQVTRDSIMASEIETIFFIYTSTPLQGMFEKSEILSFPANRGECCVKKLQVRKDSFVFYPASYRCL